MPDTPLIPEPSATALVPATALTGITITTGPSANDLVHISLDSAEKRTQLGTYKTKENDMFLVLGITIRNSDTNEDFDYTPKSFGIYDKTNRQQLTSSPRFASGLTNPFTSGMVPMKSEKTGQVAFVVLDSSNSYKFSVYDAKGIEIVSFDNIVVT